MTNTPHPTPTSSLGDTLSFPDVPSDGLELGNLASSFAHATLGPFEVHDVIGRGGMGIVFSGEHIDQRVPVAIKVITRHGSEKPRLRQVMHNEVRAVAGLDHPGIVRVLDYGEIPDAAEVVTEGALRAGTPYFVMEMMAHSSLIDIVGRVSWRQAKTILLNLLDALAHSHARDVIHRDIKPGNILLDDWGGRVIPKLADFGLAFATRQPTDVSRSIGTPQYMAPEQIETPWRKHGPWSDLYSVGCLAFELLTGRKLFAGKSILEIFRMHLDGVRKPLRSIVRVPDGFDAWLNRMIERVPEDRYRSAADAARALAALDDSDVSDVRPPDCVTHDFAQLTPSLGSLDSGAMRPGFDLARRYPVSMRLVGAGLGLFGLREIPLVGRDTQLDALWREFSRSRKGEPRAVVIHGANGVGKTKLADAFVQRLSELGIASSMRAKHQSGGSEEDGAPRMLANWLRAAGATRAEAGGIVRGVLGADAQRFEWESVLALIEPTLAGGGESEVAFQFASNRQRHEVVIQQIRRAAETRPVVAVFDDVHFSEDSLELLTHAIESIDAPVLFVLTVCDEELAELPDAAQLVAQFEAMDVVLPQELGPLDRVDHVDLVQDLLMLSGDLAIGVADRTQGNPGFAVHLIDDWIRAGHLEVGETGFVLDEDADLLGDIPSSARDAWRGTLDRMFAGRTESEKMSLELAAALGVVVWSDEWVGVCEQEGLEPCWEALGDLVDRRLAKMTNTGWRFEHPVAVEFLRTSAQTNDRWRRWNVACASWLEEAHDPTPKQTERLGEHWLTAGVFERARQPLQDSVQRKLAQGDYREGERLATGMLRALKEGDGTPEDIADAYLLRSRIYIGMGRSDEALRWARKALTAAEENDLTDILPKATGFVALAKQWLGAADARDWLDRALDQLDGLEATFRPDGILMILGYQLTSLGRFDDAKRVLELDHQLAVAADDARALASSTYQLSRTAFYTGDYDVALEYGEAARDRCVEMGHLPALAQTLSLLAEILRFQEKFERAETIYREAIEISQSTGQATFVAKASLAGVLLAQQNWDEAEQLFIAAAGEAATAGRRRTEIGCRAGLLVCAVEQGHWSSARRLIGDIEEFCTNTTETEPDLPKLLEQAGDRFAAEARCDEARVVWELALTQWKTLEAADHVATVQRKLDEIVR